MVRSLMALSCMSLAAVAMLGCGSMEHARQWQSVDQAVAVVHPTEGNDAHGTVLFTKEGDAVRVRADIRGLEPNGTHAIHVHEYGDCTAADGTSAGGHYNPEGHDHALPGERKRRHAGDFGNLVADGDGRATLDLRVKNITVAGKQNPVVGYAVIVHADSDKGHAEQPTGAAGPRIGCGAIGVANPDLH